MICQSNPELAGSPRKAFRCRLGAEPCGGRALDGLGREYPYRTQPNYECHAVLTGSESVGDKPHGQKGNSPDRQLRSRNGG